MFCKSKVSSFRNAGIKLIFSFLKHLKLGLKTIPLYNFLNKGQKNEYFLIQIIKCHHKLKI
jgi:hypothetical protein